MDVAKMRRQAERVAGARERAEAAAYWAAMTPEHRALHERPTPAVCGVCINVGLERMREAIRVLTQRAAVARLARAAAAEGMIQGVRDVTEARRETTADPRRIGVRET